MLRKTYSLSESLPQHSNNYKLHAPSAGDSECKDWMLTSLYLNNFAGLARNLKQRQAKNQCLIENLFSCRLKLNVRPPFLTHLQIDPGWREVDKLASMIAGKVGDQLF